jgi:hypothetical protein
MTQYNLANALEKLGERKRDPDLVCEALQSALDAWEVSSAGGDIYIASMAANNGLREISLLASMSKQTAQRYVNRYKAQIQKMKAWQRQHPPTAAKLG